MVGASRKGLNHEPTRKSLGAVTVTPDEGEVISALKTEWPQSCQQLQPVLLDDGQQLDRHPARALGPGLPFLNC